MTNETKINHEEIARVAKCYVTYEKFPDIQEISKAYLDLKDENERLRETLQNAGVTIGLTPPKQD